MIILICIGATGSIFAQGNTTIAYSIGFPTGDLNDFIKTSYRGISLDYRHPIKESISLGVHVGWTTFYEEKKRDTYTSENASLTGKQFRYSNNVPMAATITYSLGSEEEMAIPYFSLGVGTMYTRRETNMNLYVIEEEAWNFLLQPEIGIKVTTSEFSAVSLALKYNHGFEAGDELPNAQSYLALNIGFVFF